MGVYVNILRAGYQENHIVLRESMFKAGEGEVVLISGPSGSGKSTLILAITGILKHVLGGFVEGVVDLNGLNPLEPTGFEEIPREVSVLLQDPERQLVFPTPLDEVVVSLESLGSPRSTAFEKARGILSQIGLGGKENRHVEELSSGERRRLTLALLEIGDPRVIILDEPSANLDPRGVSLIRERVRDWKKQGKTVIIVEHKIQYFTDLADTMYTLRSRKLVEDAVRDDLYVNLPECRNNPAGASELVLELRGDIGYRDYTVLRDVDFKVYRGEIVAIIGPNGSGKTTLLKTIAGLTPILNGEITTSVKKLFYAPQNPDLVFVSWSVKREVKNIVKKTGLTVEELVNMFPWLSNALDQSPFLLSHGQRRLLELLIALAHGGDLLLLDEPTTGLDPSLYHSVLRELKNTRNKGRSIVVATHDPRLVLEVDRVYKVENGFLREVDKCRVVEEMIRETGV